jgi:hypothetical protein
MTIEIANRVAKRIDLPAPTPPPSPKLRRDRRDFAISQLRLSSVSAILPPMKDSLITVFPHEGTFTLPVHAQVKRTPDAGNPAMTLQLTVESHRRRVTDLER